MDNVTSSHKGRIEAGNYRLRVVVRQTPVTKTATIEKRVDWKN
jgi:hypothetical protein